MIDGKISGDVFRLSDGIMAASIYARLMSSVVITRGRLLALEGIINDAKSSMRLPLARD